MKFIFASQNSHKAEELKNKLQHSANGNNIEIISLKDLDFEEDIPETQNTLEGNALQKANFVYQRFKSNCIADDTGLEIEALNGEPGVYSARYAGENKNFDDNMNLVLEKMQGIENRKACFRTVVALIINGKEYCFEGRIDGEILPAKKGDKGFGYDPIFRPNGYEKSFAELSLDEKNQISHRALALDALFQFLNTNNITEE